MAREVLESARDLGPGWRNRQALFLVVDGPAHIPHFGHSQQHRQPVVRLARVLAVGPPPRRDAETDACVLHGVEVLGEHHRIARVVVAEGRRIDREGVRSTRKRLGEPRVVEGGTDGVRGRGMSHGNTEQVGHRGRGGVSRGGGDAAHAQAILDRPQQGIVVVGKGRRPAGLSAGGDEDGGDLVDGREVVLVPRDDQQ